MLLRSPSVCAWFDGDGDGGMESTCYSRWDSLVSGWTLTSHAELVQSPVVQGVLSSPHLPSACSLIHLWAQAMGGEFSLPRPACGLSLWITLNWNPWREGSEEGLLSTKHTPLPWTPTPKLNKQADLWQKSKYFYLNWLYISVRAKHYKGRRSKVMQFKHMFKRFK